MWGPAMLSRPLACAVLVLLLTSGCRDRESTAYRAPKDPVAAAPGPARRSGMISVPLSEPRSR